MNSHSAVAGGKGMGSDSKAVFTKDMERSGIAPDMKLHLLPINCVIISDED